MANVVVTDLAKADIDDIWYFYANTRGLKSADEVMDSIWTNVTQASKLPGIGEEQERYGKGMRRIVVQKTFSVFYQIIPNGIAVVRCLHEARDVDGLMLK